MTAPSLRDLRIPMRDGVELCADVWLAAESPVPVLLTRLPYGKDGDSFTAPLMPPIERMTAAGYSVVVEECRGTFGSDGEFRAFEADVEDGEDTVRWLARQPWCDGSIGMFGSSYLGYTQWMTAVTGVPALRAIVPAYSGSDPYRGFNGAGGVQQHSGFRDWSASLFAERELRAARRGEPARPWTDGWWQDWGAHPIRDETWDRRSVRDRLDGVRIPALHVSGWFDLFVGETLATYERAQQVLPPELAAEQRLIIGPWDHLDGSGVYRDRDFGPTASVSAADPVGAYLRFHDRWVRGREDALADDPRVRVFVMGHDRWHSAEAWPLPGTVPTPYYLGADGTLDLTPSDRDAEHAYTVDPDDPVPTTGGASLPMDPGFGGPVDQAPLDDRHDIVRFVSAPLTAEVQVVGRAVLRVFVATSAPDIDIAARLIDVDPDGRALSLCDGILRLRYREGTDHEAPAMAGEPVEVEVDLAATGNAFLPGHRIRLDVSSSNFPHYALNERVTSPAQVRLLTGPAHPSRLILPLVGPAWLSATPDHAGESRTLRAGGVVR